jgi:hypothetical protein
VERKKRFSLVQDAKGFVIVGLLVRKKIGKDTRRNVSLFKIEREGHDNVDTIISLCSKFINKKNIVFNLVL